MADELDESSQWPLTATKILKTVGPGTHLEHGAHDPHNATLRNVATIMNQQKATTNLLTPPQLR